MRQLILVAIIMTFFACKQGDKQLHTIKGTAPGFEDGTEIYLQDLGPNNRRIALDTAIVTGEQFSFNKPQNGDKGLQILSTPNIREQLLVVKDTETLTITLYKDSLQASIVKGSVENELFNTYRNESRIESVKKLNLRKLLRTAQTDGDNELVQQYVSQIKEMDNSFINRRKELLTAHSDKMVAITALADLINAKVLTGEETGTYFDGLSENVKNSAIGTSVNQFIAQQKAQQMASKLASVGNKAPEFSGSTPEGKELSLSETLGEYTIIDFWASWCKPCRVENPNVVRVYNKYHDKGLNIISVSLDRPGQKDRWIKAIEKDQMDWYHISNLQYWQDPIPKSYGVRAIPATFLLDKEGVIIAKNLRGRALEAKMDELLGSGS